MGQGFKVSKGLKVKSKDKSKDKAGATNST